MSQIIKIRLARFLFIGLITLILIDSTRPPPIEEASIAHLDKLLHFLVYGLIAYLYAYAYLLKGHIKKLSIYKFLGAALFILLFGILVEYIQSHTPGRDASVADIIADVLGACAFLSLLQWQIKRNLISNP